MLASVVLEDRHPDDAIVMDAVILRAATAPALLPRSRSRSRAASRSPSSKHRGCVDEDPARRRHGRVAAGRRRREIARGEP